jgi:hypothetical protein
MQTAITESETGEKFISLPALFKLSDSSAPHGLVLKSGSRTKPAPCETTILLAPKIDIELEIPIENIQVLPKSLAGQFRYFRAAYFSGDNLILILDPDKLTESVT